MDHVLTGAMIVRTQTQRKDGYFLFTSEYLLEIFVSNEDLSAIQEIMPSQFQRIILDRYHQHVQVFPIQNPQERATIIPPWAAVPEALSCHHEAAE